MSRIEKTIRLHSKANNSDSSSSSKQNAYTLSRLENDIAATNQFDSTVTELDAYLQLLIEQQQSLEQKHLGSNSLEPTPPEKISDETKNIELISASTTKLIETIKHAIVCLQIAKVNCDPKFGLHTSNDLKQVLSFFNSCNKSSKPHGGDEIKAAASHSLDTDEQLHLKQAIAPKKLLNNECNKNLLDIPLKSFSNSDDEENKSFTSLTFKEKTQDIIDNTGEDEEDEDFNFNNSDEENESFYDAVDSGGSVVDAQPAADYSIPDINVVSIETDEEKHSQVFQIDDSPIQLGSV